MCVAEWEPLPHEFFAFLCTGANPPCLLKRVQYGICSLMHSLWSQACALRRQSCNASEASFKINRRSLLAKPVQGFYLNEQMGKMQEMATEVLLIKRDDKLSVWVSLDPPLHTWWVICFYFPRDCKEKKLPNAAIAQDLREQNWSGYLKPQQAGEGKAPCCTCMDISTSCNLTRSLFHFRENKA